MVKNWSRDLGEGTMDLSDLDDIDDPTYGLSSDTLDYLRQLGVEDPSRPGGHVATSSGQKANHDWDAARDNPEVLFDLIAVEKAKRQNNAESDNGGGTGGLKALLAAFPGSSSSPDATTAHNGVHPRNAHGYIGAPPREPEPNRKASKQKGRRVANDHDLEAIELCPVTPELRAGRPRKEQKGDSTSSKAKKPHGKGFIGLFGRHAKKEAEKNGIPKSQGHTQPPVQTSSHRGTRQQNASNRSGVKASADSVVIHNSKGRPKMEPRRRSALNSSASSADSATATGVMEILLNDSTFSLSDVAPESGDVTPQRSKHWNGYVASPGVFGIHPTAKSSATPGGVISACVLIDAATQTQTDTSPEDGQLLTSNSVFPTDREKSQGDMLQSVDPTWRGADVADRKSVDEDNIYQNPTMRAAAEGDERVLGQLEVARGLRDKMGNTPLHLSATGGHLGCVKLLYKKQPSWLSAENKDKLTPAAAAIKNGQTEVLDWFLDHTPLSRELVCQRSKRPLLHHAAKFGQDGCLRLLLQRLQTHDGTATSLDSYGNSPAHIAAKYGQLTCLQTLAEFGVDLTLANQYGQTPCYYADFADHRLCVGYLMILDNCLGLIRKLVRLEKDTSIDASSGCSSSEDTPDELKVKATQMMTHLFKESRKKLLVFRTQGEIPKKVSPTSETEGSADMTGPSMGFQPSSSSAFRRVQDRGSRQDPSCSSSSPLSSARSSEDISVASSLARLAVRARPEHPAQQLPVGSPTTTGARESGQSNSTVLQYDLETNISAKTNESQRNEPQRNEETRIEARRNETQRSEIRRSEVNPSGERVSNDMTGRERTGASVFLDATMQGRNTSNSNSSLTLHGKSTDEENEEFLLSEVATGVTAREEEVVEWDGSGGVVMQNASFTSIRDRARHSYQNIRHIDHSHDNRSHNQDNTSHNRDNTSHSLDSTDHSNDNTNNSQDRTSNLSDNCGQHHENRFCHSNTENNATIHIVRDNGTLGHSTNIPSYTELPELASYSELPASFEPDLTSSTNSSARVRESLLEGTRPIARAACHTTDLRHGTQCSAFSTFKSSNVNACDVKSMPESPVTNIIAQSTSGHTANESISVIQRDSSCSDLDSISAMARLVEQDLTASLLQQEERDFTFGAATGPLKGSAQVQAMDNLCYVDDDQLESIKEILDEQPTVVPEIVGPEAGVKIGTEDGKVSLETHGVQREMDQDFNEMLVDDWTHDNNNDQTMSCIQSRLSANGLRHNARSDDCSERSGSTCHSHVLFPAEEATPVSREHLPGQRLTSGLSSCFIGPTSGLSNDRIPVKLQLSHSDFSETYVRQGHCVLGQPGGDQKVGRALKHGPKDGRKKKNVHFQDPPQEAVILKPSADSPEGEGLCAGASGAGNKPGGGNSSEEWSEEVEVLEQRRERFREMTDESEFSDLSNDVSMVTRPGGTRIAYEEHFTIL